MFLMSDKLYERLKKLTLVILPAISALYFGLASIWGLPEPDKVVGSIACLQVFLGACLGISNSTYKALDAGNIGDVVVTEDKTGKKTLSFEANGDPLDILEQRSEVKFKVRKQ